MVNSHIKNSEVNDSAKSGKNSTSKQADVCAQNICDTNTKVYSPNNQLSKKDFTLLHQNRRGLTQTKLTKYLSPCIKALHTFYAYQNTIWTPKKLKQL